jgi:hypothetical protein
MMTKIRGISASQSRCLSRPRLGGGEDMSW